jgi:signal transduction histidine kinase
MKIAPVAAVVPVMIVLLTWLSFASINPGAEHFDVALKELDRFGIVEAALHRDVLSARTGVLRNYDPLVRETNALDDSVDRLRQIVPTDAAIKSSIEDLAASVARQEELVEHFKSNNALLQNSLASFAVISSRLSSLDWSEAMTHATNALVAAMLRLSLDTSAEPLAEVRDRLDKLSALGPPSVEALPVMALVAHGRLLNDLLPATDEILRDLLSMPQRNQLEVLRQQIQKRQSTSRETARAYRRFLYTTSLLLVGLLAYLGWQLQARAQALRRRAAFEHVIAGISMSLVSAPAQQIGAIVEQALADLARCLRAERGYCLLSGNSSHTYVWRGPQMEFPAGWPDRTPLLMDLLGPAINGIVHVPQVARLPLGEARTVLETAGLRGWACTSREGTDGDRIILGFDAVTHRFPTIGIEELGLLRMALDAIGNALGRQVLEEERAHLESRLQQARRLATVGALASGIAHNFNNIVGAILGYTEMAAESDASAGRTSPLLDEIHRAGERARELVDQILGFARRRDMRRSPVNMTALVAETASLLQASLPVTIEIVLQQTAEPAVVSGEAVQLQQVILNLCHNAAQAMNNTGRVELQVDVIKLLTTRSNNFGMLAPGSYVRIAVSDAGRGIDAGDLDRIFEPFFTTRMTGNGLGLATTLEIVRDHGGAMNVASAVGEGSRFEAWLPCSAAATSASPEGISVLPLGSGETVLVVEDDPERLLRDEEILAALGYEPVGAAGAADARAKCRLSRDRFDLILVGQLVPATAAIELATALRPDAPNVAILLATASADQVAANSLMEAGISDVIAWPVVAAELAVALAGCLRRRRAKAPIRAGVVRRA